MFDVVEAATPRCSSILGSASETLLSFASACYGENGHQSAEILGESWKGEISPLSQSLCATSSVTSAWLTPRSKSSCSSFRQHLVECEVFYDQSK